MNTNKKCQSSQPPNDPVFEQYSSSWDGRIASKPYRRHPQCPKTSYNYPVSTYRINPLRSFPEVTRPKSTYQPLIISFPRIPYTNRSDNHRKKYPFKQPFLSLFVHSQNNMTPYAVFLRCTQPSHRLSSVNVKKLAIRLVF